MYQHRRKGTLGRRWRLWGILALFLAVGLAGSQPALAARDISVGVNPAACNGPCHYTSIPAAIQGAANGDTIWVYAGTYKGPITVDKSIALVAAGDRGSTVIDGTGLDSIVIITASGARLGGFTIQNSELGGVVINNANNVVVENNLVRWTGRVQGQEFDAGKSSILVHAGKGNWIVNNTVIDNYGRGIRIEGFEGMSDGNVVRGNFIANSMGGCGLVLTTNVTNTLVEYNRLERNVNGGVIVAVLSPTAINKGNIFQYNDVKWTITNPGFLLSLTVGAGSDRVSGNIVRYNNIESNTTYRAFPASGNTGVILEKVSGNQVYGNRIWNQDTAVANSAPLSVLPNQIRDNDLLFVRTALVEGPAPAPAAPAALPRTGEADLSGLMSAAALVGGLALGLGLGLVARRRATQA